MRATTHLHEQIATLRRLVRELDGRLGIEEEGGVSREEDERIRALLHALGDRELRDAVLGYVTCVRGLGSSLSSETWKAELHEQVAGARQRVEQRLTEVDDLLRRWTGVLRLTLVGWLGRLRRRLRRERWQTVESRSLLRRRPEVIRGTQEAILHKVTPYDLHGQRYYEFLYTLVDEEGSIRGARLSSDAVYPNPRPGDRVQLFIVMNLVVQVQKL